MRALPPHLRRPLRAAVILLSSLCLGFSGIKAFGEVPPTPDSFTPVRNGPTRDVINEETLSALAQQANKQAATIAAKTIPVSAPPPSTQSSLLTSSILISDGEKFTIIPVGSVLHLPTNLRSRIIAQPQGDVLMWPDFLQKNSAWITAKEVTLPMSQGDSKAAAPILREIANETRLVVAVYRNCPITILEPAKASDPRNHKSADNH